MKKRRKKWLERLGNRRKFPRSLWYPVYKPFHFHSDGDRLGMHDKLSGTIQNLIITILGVGFFCILMLGKSDIDLLTRESKIKAPFAGVDISFGGFIILAPVLLIGLNVYLQSFLRQWLLIRAPHYSETTPYIFNLRGPLARVLSYLLFYWTVPVTLIAIVVKALPHPDARIVFYVVCGGLFHILYVRIRREEHHRLWRNSLRWSALAYVVYISAHAALVGVPWPFQRVMNLYSTSLQGREIIGFNLIRADMRKVNLEKSDLTCTTVERANIVGGRLSRTRLYRVNFRRAVLLSADLSRASLLRANFAGADLGSANLNRARVIEPLSKEELTATNWVNWRQHKVDEPRSVLDSSQCRVGWRRRKLGEGGGGYRRPSQEHPGLVERDDIREYILDPANFIYANFEKANLRGANMTHGDFRASIFADADLSSVAARRSRFARSVFSAAVLREANFQEADLRGANFRDADLNGAILRKADLKNAVFVNADLSEADLRGARGLNVKALSLAKTLYRARLDAPLARRLGRLYPHLLREDADSAAPPPVP